MDWIISFGTIFMAYVLGSLPFAVIVSQLMGLQDPRQFGSKNPGATNVLRTGNKKAAAFTLLGDLLKGTLAVVLAKIIVEHAQLSTAIIAFSAVAAFLGHVFPFTLGFKGGKGVATAVGVLFALQPGIALAAVATWLLVAYLSRYSSLAAMVAAIMAPIYYLVGANILWLYSNAYAFSILCISIILLWRHQANISRLLQGKESRIGDKKP